MIESALESVDVTSANPTHTNKVIQVNNIEMPDLDAIVREGRDEPTTIKENLKLKNTVSTVQEYEQGTIGKIKDLTTAQAGNLISFARNPFQFIVSSVFRKFTKGAGILALITIIFEAVKTIIMELFKPGRFFDTRFRERIGAQVLLFLERKEQQELRQGFKRVITTTIGGLRGNTLQGQIGGNFYNPERIPFSSLDTRRISADNFSARDVRIRSFQDVGMAAARAGRG